MFHFSIRDVLWLTALVAMAVGWWADHQAIELSRRALRWQAAECRAHSENLQQALRYARLWHEVHYLGKKPKGYEIVGLPGVPWHLADKPIP